MPTSPPLIDYSSDRISFELYSCLVVAIENREGRVPEGLTEHWLDNAKRAVRSHEARCGVAANNLMYPQPKGKP